MQPAPPSTQELDARFTYHTINTQEKRDDISELRSTFRAVAEQIVTLVPPGREQATALTKLEEAAFFAIAGVARHQ